jgi:hypothetical protein
MDILFLLELVVFDASLAARPAAWKDAMTIPAGRGKTPKAVFKGTRRAGESA